MANFSIRNFTCAAEVIPAVLHGLGGRQAFKFSHSHRVVVSSHQIMDHEEEVHYKEDVLPTFAEASTSDEYFQSGEPGPGYSEFPNQGELTVGNVSPRTAHVRCSLGRAHHSFTWRFWDAFVIYSTQSKRERLAMPMKQPHSSKISSLVLKHVTFATSHCLMNSRTASIT